MPQFTVKKPCRPIGAEYMTKGDVTITDGQAKYLLLSGHLVPKVKEPVTTEKKTVKEKKADTK